MCHPPGSHIAGRVGTLPHYRRGCRAASLYELAPGWVYCSTLFSCYSSQPVGREGLARPQHQLGVEMGPSPPVMCEVLGGVARAVHTCWS